MAIYKVNSHSDPKGRVFTRVLASPAIMRLLACKFMCTPIPVFAVTRLLIPHSGGWSGYQ